MSDRVKPIEKILGKMTNLLNEHYSLTFIVELHPKGNWSLSRKLETREPVFFFMCRQKQTLPLKRKLSFLFIHLEFVSHPPYRPDQFPFLPELTA